MIKKKAGREPPSVLTIKKKVGRDLLDQNNSRDLLHRSDVEDKPPVFAKAQAAESLV